VLQQQQQQLFTNKYHDLEVFIIDDDYLRTVFNGNKMHEASMLVANPDRYKKIIIYI
jgi:hypothetical protein